MVTVIHPSSTQQQFGNHHSYYAPEFLNYPSTTTNAPNKYDPYLSWSSSTLNRSTSYSPYPFQLSSYDSSQNRIRSYLKDYSKPLFVDCSIEYELPNAPKISQSNEPILIIHPSYQRASSSRVKKEGSGIRGLLDEKALNRGTKRSFKEVSNEKMNENRETRLSSSFINCCCSCHNSMFPKRSRPYSYDNFKMPISPEGFLDDYSQRVMSFSNWT